MPIKPKSRPKLDKKIVREVADRRENPHSDGPGIVAACPVMILGVRGNYCDTLGRLGVNDFGVCDDAGFLMTPRDVTAFNWNCDPSRKGWNAEVGKNCQVIVGRGYVNHNSKLIDCSKSGASTYSTLGQVVGRVYQTKDAYTVSGDMVTALSGDDNVVRDPLFQEQDLALSPEIGVAKAQEISKRLESCAS